MPDDFVYDYIIPRLKGVRNHQILSASSFFTFGKAPRTEKGVPMTIFYPGCSLPAYSPDLVLKTYGYLQRVIPGIGIILNCCGKPCQDMGDEPRFHKVLNGSIKQFSRLGVEEVVLACINCHKTFRENSDIKIRTVYEIMSESGLPEYMSGKGGRITMHDSCPARFQPKIRDAARNIVSRLDYEIDEFNSRHEKTQCCGAGGCSPKGNTTLAERHTKARAARAKSQIVTYCAHCRERFSTQVPALHILDLVFSTSPMKKHREHNDGWLNWFNRWFLKKRLQLMH